VAFAVVAVVFETGFLKVTVPPTKGIFVDENPETES
jgi:hypothetical protein